MSFILLHLVGDRVDPVNIRFASQSDLKGIYLVEDDSFSEPYSHDVIAKLLRDCPSSFLVAEYPPGTIIGYCVATEKGKSGHLISIGVLREYRRQGVGTRLIQRLLIALGSRVKELRLEVKQSNTEAVTFYEELGFKQGEFIENYYEDGSTAVKMLRKVDEAHAWPSRSRAK
jgi:ribosomal-protein-alanine N-acetyltransferase